MRAGRLAPGGWRSSRRASLGSWRRPSCSSARTTTNYPYRLAGTRLCEVFGLELRGTNFLDGWSEPGPRRTCRSPGFDLRAGRRDAPDPGGGAEGARRVQIEAILLPLMHPEGTIGRLIGAMSASYVAALAGPRAARAKASRPPRAHLAGRPAALADFARGPQRPVCLLQAANACTEIDGAGFRVLEGGRAKDAEFRAPVVTPFMVSSALLRPHPKCGHCLCLP